MIKSLFRKFLISTAPFLFTAPALAQDSGLAEDTSKGEAIDTLKPVAEPRAPRDVDPALWVVKDKDTTLYLFGTVHILKPGLGWYDEAVKDAFEKSDSLVLELVEPTPAKAQELFAKTAIDKTGKPLRSKLTDEQRSIYDDAMKKIGMPVEGFDPFDPWAAAVSIQLLGLTAKKYDQNSGVEKQLSAVAKAANKPILGVETMEYQLGIFDKLSQKDQIDFLIENAKAVDKVEDNMDKLVELWGKPDPDGLARMMNEGFTNADLYSELLTKRNAKWAQWINTRMKKPGTVFMAVGAGHLAGSTSVQNLLTAYGLKAERVQY